MRSVVLSVPVWLLLGAAALAQGTANAPPPLPPSDQAASPLPPNLAPPAAMPAPAQQPATLGGQEPVSTGAANLNQQDQPYRKVAPALPTPELGPNATPVDYLHAAEAALAGGRTGEAQQSLEMAQTRLLDRSVPYGQVNTPIKSPAIDTISQALQALGAGDRAQTMQLIQAAIHQAEAAR
ncbi:MAG TPA: hypothetical protein VFN42_14165 [Acetobacteraceae bacterium]|nr:hypothetical protein [Acetobacteraceae bacterium]